MRKLLPIVFNIGISTLVLFYSAQGFSAPPAPPAPAKPPKVYHWYHKLGRGALNIVSAPADMMMSVTETSLAENHYKGFTVGFYRGVKNGARRLGAGFVDLLTFPLNYPKPKKTPLVEPEFYWQAQQVERRTFRTISE